MNKVERRLEEGFEFVPKSARAFEEALELAGFQPDQREMHLGFIPSAGTLAALATHGQGYREKGSPSLHCAVASDKCSVHLDNIGFRCDGYQPNAGQHVADELLWQAIIVPALGKFLPTAITDVLHRFHPVVPNSGQFKPFSRRGVEFDLASGRSPDLQRQWRVTVDLTQSCSDKTCGLWRLIDEKKVQGADQVMVKFSVTGW
jgi:hypothetical protein